MDYQEIDAYMKRRGFDEEPAFQFLHFLTEPITSPADRRILGLYYPQGEEAGKGIGYLPPSTIILPEDASEGTLLHELGHRYGDFHFNNISESFAENFRKRYQRNGNLEMLTSRTAVAVASDWSVDGFAFRSAPAALKAGVGIDISVDGFVNELRDTYPDFWQVAVVVSYSNLDFTIARSDFQVFQSGIDGVPFPYATRIDCSNSYLFPYRLGAMPNRNIFIIAQVYANHNHLPLFTPFDYARLASNGWEYLDTIVTQILLDTAPPPPPGGGMQLYKQARTAAAETYRGKAEQAIFTFSTGPEQLDVINNFFINQLVGECQGAIQQNSPGDQLLTLQLYRDTSPTLRTDYKLYLTATDITGNNLLWGAIILTALAIILYLVVVGPLLEKIIKLLYGPEGKPSVLLIAVGLGAVLVGMALVKGTSVKGAVTGNR